MREAGSDYSERTLPCINIRGAHLPGPAPGRGSAAQGCLYSATRTAFNKHTGAKHMR